MVVRRTTTQSIRRFPVLLVLPFPSSSPVMDAEYGTAKLHQGAGVASQPSPCPSPLPVSSAAASSTPTVSSSMPAPATTVATSSESVEAEAGHIYQPGTKAEVRLVYRIKKGPGAGRHQKSFSISRYGVQGAWEQAEAARQYINAHGTLPPHFVVQSLPSKSNSSSSSNQKGRRGPASSAAASAATAGYTSNNSSGASSGAGAAGSVNSHSSGQGDGAGRQRGAGGGASGGGRSGGRGGSSSSKGGGDGTEKKGRLNASQGDVGSGFLNCGTGARGGGRGRAAASRAAPLVGFPSPTSSGASAHNVYLNLQGRGILPAGLRGMVHPYVFLASGGAGTTPVTAAAGAGSAARAPRVSGTGDEAQRLGAQPNPFIGILPNVLNPAVVAQGGGGVVKGLPLPGAQPTIPSPAGTIASSCSTSSGVKTAPVSSALPSVSVTPSVGPPGGAATPSSAAPSVSTVVAQHTPGDPNSNKAAPHAVAAMGRESEMLQAGLTEGGCIRLFLPFSALSRTVVMPPGGTAATIIVPETKILVQPGTVGTVVIAANPSGAAAGGVCGMSAGGESGGSPTCTSSTTAGGGSNADDECHASSEASSSTSTSPVSSRGVGTVVVGGDRGSTTEQTSGLHTGVTDEVVAAGEGGQSTPGGPRPASSAAASSSVTGGAAEDGANSVCGMQEKDISQESGVLEGPESKSAGDNDLKRPLPAEETSTFSRPAGRDTLWLFPLVDGCDSAAPGTEANGGNGTASTAGLGRDGTSKGDAANSDQGTAPWVVESSTLLSAAAGLAEVTFLSSPVPSPPGSPRSMCRSGFAGASPGSGAARVRPFKRRCLDVSPLFLCSGSPPTGTTGDTSSTSAGSTHAEHGSSLCPRTSSLDSRNGAVSTGSSLTFLLSSPPSSEYRRGPFAGFASPLPSGSKSGASAGVSFPALPPPLASFRSPDIAVQQLSRRSREASRSESRESSCGNEKTTKKASAAVKGERSETPVGDKKEKKDGQVSCKGRETGSGSTSALAALSSPVSELFSSPSLPVSGKSQERGAVRLKNHQYDIGGSLSASSSSVSASPSLAPSSISPFFAFSPFSVLPRPSPPCGPSSFPGVGGPASPKSGSACNNRRLVLLPAERSSFSASPLDDQSTPQLFTNSNPPVFSEALSTSPGLFALSSPSVASSGLLEPPHSSPSRGPSPVGQSNECASGDSLVPQPGDTALNSVSDSGLKPGLELHDRRDSGSGDGLGDEDGKPEGAPVSGPSPLLLSAGVGQLPPDDGCAAAQLGPSVIGDAHEQDTPPQAARTSPVQPEPGGGGGSSPSASSEKSSGFLGLDGSSRVQSVLASLVAEGGLLGTSMPGKIGDRTTPSGGEPQQQKQEDRVFAGKATPSSPAVQTVPTGAARASA